MIREVNPDFYRELINDNEALKINREIRSKGSSSSVGMVSEAEADSESVSQIKNKKRMLKRLEKIKTALNKVLISSIFKHVIQIEENISKFDS
jgi:hypothetical protein